MRSTRGTKKIATTEVISHKKKITTELSAPTEVISVPSISCGKPSGSTESDGLRPGNCFINHYNLFMLLKINDFYYPKYAANMRCYINYYTCCLIIIPKTL